MWNVTSVIKTNEKTTHSIYLQNLFTPVPGILSESKWSDVHTYFILFSVLSKLGIFYDSPRSAHKEPSLKLSIY